jgi:hypothetical protein
MQSAAGWLPKLPLAAAAGGSGVTAGARHASPGTSGRSSDSSSASPHAKCFKVPYQFSTPTEKRLQKQLEVGLVILSDDYAEYIMLKPWHADVCSYTPPSAAFLQARRHLCGQPIQPQQAPCRHACMRVVASDENLRWLYK